MSASKMVVLEDVRTVLTDEYQTVRQVVDALDVLHVNKWTSTEAQRHYESLSDTARYTIVHNLLSKLAVKGEVLQGVMTVGEQVRGRFKTYRKRPAKIPPKTFSYETP